MNDVLRLAIVDPDDAAREELKSMLLGMDRIWLEAEASRYEFFADVVAQTEPDIGLVCLDGDPDKALNLVATVTQKSPSCSILVVSSSSDGGLILRAMRSGAKEFLPSPVAIDDLIGALERIDSLKQGRAGDKNRSSTVYAVAGATGGVGSTSLAVNLGCALAQDPAKSVALIDIDLALGDADVLLDLIPEYTFVDLAQNVSRLDFALLKGSLTKHSSGLFLLPRPMQIEDFDLITPDVIRRVVGLMKATFSHLIIDLSKGFTPMDQVAFELADHILMVTQLDLPCLRNSIRLMMAFNEMEGVADKVKVIVNRHGLGTGQISLKKACETIGRDVYWQIPNDYRTMVEVRNNGVPLVEQAPRAKVTQSITGLADALCGAQPSADEELTESKLSLGKLRNLLGGKASSEPQATE